MELSTVSEQVRALAGSIKLLILDVDGVLTDGRLWMGDNGAEYKAFNVKDGHGLKALMHNGTDVAVITGRRSSAVDRRMGELGINHYYAGQNDKIAAFNELLQLLALQPSQVAYVGDDEPDVPVMQLVALPVAVGDAHESAKTAAGWITRGNGGAGAVREVCDLLMAARQKA